MSTWLQRVWLQWAPDYSEFSYNEHPATASSVTMSTQLQRVRLQWAPSDSEWLQQAPGYSKFGYNEHLATASSVTMSTWLQWVWLQRAPSYSEFSYNEHLATASSVTMSTWLQQVRLQWAPGYSESGYNKYLTTMSRFLCFKIVDCNVKKFGYKSTHLQRVRLQRLQRADFFASKSLTAMLKNSYQYMNTCLQVPRIIRKQECISVGRVPTAAVAVTRCTRWWVGGGFCPGASLSM